MSVRVRPWSERLFILSVFQLAFSSPEHRAEVFRATEAWDLRDSLVYHTRIALWGNLHDVWNTMLWPSLFLLLARTTALFGAKTRRR